MNNESLALETIVAPRPILGQLDTPHVSLQPILKGSKLYFWRIALVLMSLAKLIQLGGTLLWAS